jgi:hypothetical protein
VTAHHIFAGIVQRKMEKLEFHHPLQSQCELVKQFWQA